tara:strand:- start:229 stop:495 length:267 start_codon:yes stop_codon:yes gene_type:complete
MALVESTEEDKIEVVGPFKTVQVRTATVIKKDDVEIARTFHRHAIEAGQNYSTESTEVKAICAAVHTSEVVAAKAAHEAVMSKNPEDR